MTISRVWLESGVVSIVSHLQSVYNHNLSCNTKSIFV